MTGLIFFWRQRLNRYKQTDSRIDPFIGKSAELRYPF